MASQFQNRLIGAVVIVAVGVIVLPSLFDDLVVGVLYGAKENLSAFYKAIDTHYPVLCGSEFWMHLTGDKDFYHRLAKAFGEVVDEDGIDGSALILAKVEEIAEEIRQKGSL